VTAAVVLSPVCDVEMPFGEFPWRFRERDDLTAEVVDDDGDVPWDVGGQRTAWAMPVGPAWER
jgi:hypothetical protein